MAQEDSDLQKIKELIEIMKDNNLVEVEIKHGDDKIFLKRWQPQPALGGAETSVPIVGPNIEAETAKAETTERPGVKPSNRQAVKAEQGQELVEIKSPIVGTFYVTPSPDSEPFVEVGSIVRPQTVVCIVEAMKVMNEIKAETNGMIVEVLATNGQAVEYGQVLFRVKPD